MSFSHHYNLGEIHVGVMIPGHTGGRFWWGFSFIYWFLVFNWFFVIRVVDLFCVGVMFVSKMSGWYAASSRKTLAARRRASSTATVCAHIWATSSMEIHTRPSLVATRQTRPSATTANATHVRARARARVHAIIATTSCKIRVVTWTGWSATTSCRPPWTYHRAPWPSTRSTILPRTPYATAVCRRAWCITMGRAIWQGMG